MKITGKSCLRPLQIITAGMYMVINIYNIIISKSIKQTELLLLIIRELIRIQLF